ncbi:MAG: ABC transporter ATP-binding protein [Nitrospirae bacterium]|nr:ABC transporter ATP-binding protein [Nitrospirota bacterium]
MINLSNVGKKFGDYWAVRDLNIEVGKGEIFGFLGPNGAGKSTTVKMIAGLLNPTEGQISAGGYDVVKDPIKTKSIIGYIPDKGFIYEKLKGREFLEFVAALYKVEDAGRIIDEMSTLFSINRNLDDLVENYSAGMRQRLVFTSALLHNPEILLIDEPIIGLDPKGVRMLKKLLEDMASRGVTIFMATHSLLLAEELCTGIGIINKGRMIAIGPKGKISGNSRGLEEFFLQITEDAGS